MRTYAGIIVLILFVVVLGMVFFVTARQARLNRSMRSEAEQVEKEARDLQNQAARLRATPGALKCPGPGQRSPRVG